MFEVFGVFGGDSEGSETGAVGQWDSGTEGQVSELVRQTKEELWSHGSCLTVV